MENYYCQQRGKICYATAAEAGKAYKKSKRYGLDIFRCSDCGHFHLGRRKFRSGKYQYKERRRLKFYPLGEEVI